jgi:molybdenum cofactor cytidylyltransferase
MASGFSKRFGKENKLLAAFRGKALARHTLDLVCGLGPDRAADPASGQTSNAGPAFGLDCSFTVFFVAAEDPVLALAGGLPVTAVRNEHPERDQRESIRLGVEAASVESGPGAAYYMFFPCDQPLLDAATVRRVVAARRPGRIVQPCRGGEPGNPVLFSAAFRDDLRGLAEGERGRDIIRRHPESLIRLETASILTDIDDPRTLSRLEKISNRGSRE